MKKILSALVLGLCCTQVIAAEGYGYKILSRTITVSPGITGHFEEVTPKKKEWHHQTVETKSMKLQEHMTSQQK